ncbi:DUF1573 domain-containing protein [Telluribacter sp.]|jgi:hypothetical protein|uniref:DUF1573 domain-containing protein n=1 Tax=Telluribacter sp. TaxID=1978767 RepID=UPI002E0EE20F|nr:DUF1573 domain-containing protein [Telluribacter sp.]
MKKILIAVFVLGLGGTLVSCGEKDSQSSANEFRDKMPVLALQDSASFDFGTIKEGDIVEKKFRFRNEGEFPLIINNVTASCGCTIPEWPREPIAPNEEASILVRFNTKGKPGPQVKTVTVYANTEPALSELRLQGIVQGGEATAAAQ